MSGSSAAPILSIITNYTSSKSHIFASNLIILKHSTFSGGLPRVIHWTMLSDGRFEFSASEEMTSDQYDVLSHHYQDPHTTTQPPVTESQPYDPYDEMFAVSGYDLPAYRSEVYDSHNSSYNIVKF